jgi:hypothetical protein
VTKAEISLVRSLAETDVVTFMPEDNTAAARARCEATIESLREMRKAGWIELGGERGTEASWGAPPDARNIFRPMSFHKAGTETFHARYFCFRHHTFTNPPAIAPSTTISARPR